jgi:hypothetical protein
MKASHARNFRRDPWQIGDQSMHLAGISCGQRSVDVQSRPTPCSGHPTEAPGFQELTGWFEVHLARARRWSEERVHAKLATERVKNTLIPEIQERINRAAVRFTGGLKDYFPGISFE